jgi:hypothetical protein
MYGPTTPPFRPPGQSSELRQYAMSEWNAEPAFLIKNAERERPRRNIKAKEGRIKKQLVRIYTRLIGFGHKKPSHSLRSGHKHRGIR